MVYNIRADVNSTGLTKVQTTFIQPESKDNEWAAKKFDRGGIRTHAPEETSALN